MVGCFGLLFQHIIFAVALRLCEVNGVVLDTGDVRYTDTRKFSFFCLVLLICLRQRQTWLSYIVDAFLSKVIVNPDRNRRIYLQQLTAVSFYSLGSVSLMC